MYHLSPVIARSQRLCGNPASGYAPRCQGTHPAREDGTMASHAFHPTKLFLIATAPSALLAASP